MRLKDEVYFLNEVDMRLISEKKEEENPKKEDLYITFTELYARKQCWIEQKLAEGHRVFINPKKGRILQVSLVEYK